MKPIKLLSLFSGIGAFEKALTRLGIPFEVVHYCEIDKYPAKAYSLIHNIPEEKNLWDVKAIDLDNLANFDLLTWGFPCQDISVAGKAKGLKLKCNACDKEFNLSELIEATCPHCRSQEISSSTRSGLYFEGLKVLLKKKPKYSIIENVKGLTNKKNRKNLEQILQDLEDAGYNNYWKVLNAKNYGVPQNRERIFIISIRKDIKQDFQFPEGFDSGIRLKHILEPEVAEKYYIPQERCERLLKDLKEKIKSSPNNVIQLTNPSFSQQRVYSAEGNAPSLAAGNRGGGKESYEILEVHGNSDSTPIKLFDIPKQILNDNERQRRVYSPEGISPTILARNDNAKILQVGKLDMRGSEQVRRVYNPEGLSPTLDTMQGGHRQPKIITYDVSTKVYMRKYKVDTKELQQVLYEAKKKCSLSNKGIAESLQRPVTMVEHWFRTDSSFSIPAPDVWFELKALLQIDTDEFDAPITVFEEKDGVYEKSNRIYDEEGIAPTLTSATPYEKILTKEPCTPNELEFLGGIDTGKKWLEDGKTYSRNFKQGNRVYSPEGIACSQTANGGGLGGATGLYAVYDPYNRTLPKDQEATTTLRTNYSNGNAQLICIEDYVLRIRKLTPLECFLLMGFDKGDFDILKKHGFSDTRLYKMAGNSIVVNVLEYIFEQLFLKK